VRGQFAPNSVASPLRLSWPVINGAAGRWFAGAAPGARVAEGGGLLSGWHDFRPSPLKSVSGCPRERKPPSGDGGFPCESAPDRTIPVPTAHRSAHSAAVHRADIRLLRGSRPLAGPSRPPPILTTRLPWRRPARRPACRSLSLTLGAKRASCAFSEGKARRRRGGSRRNERPARPNLAQILAHPRVRLSGCTTSRGRMDKPKRGGSSLCAAPSSCPSPGNRWEKPASAQ